MASGGHARSGPMPEEGSARSESMGYKLTELPAEGYDGSAPEWPIEPAASEVEARYWESAWQFPQAHIWSRQEFSYLVPAVARWVRLSVRCDDPEAPATLLARLGPASDDVGMSSAGLARLGAKIKPNELSERRAEKASPPQGRQRRLRAAGS